MAHRTHATEEHAAQQLQRNESLLQLQARVSRGEYNPANTRVLHFVHNPEAEARREHEAARISALEAESATLRAQLQALQPNQAGGGPAEEQLSMSAAVAAAEKTVLERKVSPLYCICLHFHHTLSFLIRPVASLIALRCWRNSLGLFR